MKSPEDKRNLENNLLPVTSGMLELNQTKSKSCMRSEKSTWMTKAAETRCI